MKAILTNGREIIDVAEVKTHEELLELNKIALMEHGRGFIWRIVPCEVRQHSKNLHEAISENIRNDVRDGKGWSQEAMRSCLPHAKKKAEELLQAL